MGKKFNIYFKDLHSHAQNKVLSTLGLDIDYGLETQPLAVIEVEDRVSARVKQNFNRSFIIKGVLTGRITLKEGNAKEEPKNLAPNIYKEKGR